MANPFQWIHPNNHSTICEERNQFALQISPSLNTGSFIILECIGRSIERYLCLFLLFYTFSLDSKQNPFHLLLNVLFCHK